MERNREDQVAEWVERYGRMVFAAAYRILGNPEDAEDAIQEMFLKLLDRRYDHLFAETGKEMGPYLRVTASHCAVDLLRCKSKEKQVHVELFEEIEASDDQNPRHRADGKQKAALLRQALNALPERDAQIFALRYFEDLSYEEIVEQMNLNINQVGVVLHRSRHRLQEILQPKLEPDIRPVENRPRNAEPGKEDCHV